MTPRALRRFTVLGSVLFMLCAALWSVSWPVEAQPSQSETPSRCVTARPLTVSVSLTTTTELIAAVSGQRVYACGIYLDNDTATTELQFKYGTGTLCATNETNLTGAITAAAVSMANAGATQLTTGSGTAMCLELNSNTQVNGWLTYVQY